MTSSPAILAGLDLWRENRRDFADYLEAQHQAADLDTNGVLLNRRGRAAGIDPHSLFYGPRSRVDAYASEELRDWFTKHGRTTFAEYERTRSPMPGHEWGAAPEERHP